MKSDEKRMNEELKRLRKEGRISEKALSVKITSGCKQTSSLLRDTEIA